VTKYKQLIYRIAAARKVRNDKLEAKQLLENDPTATPTQIQTARRQFNNAVVASDTLAEERDTQNVQVYTVAATTLRRASAGAALAASGVVAVLAVLLM